MSVAETRRSRWSRRARTIPVMLGCTAFGILLSPLLVPALAIRDVIGRRTKLPTARVALFLLQYGINDSAEILVAPILWARARVDRTLDRSASTARYERVQRWSVELLARRAEQLLGLRIDIDDESLAALTPGPVVVLCRHVNLVDASLPALLYQRIGFHTRGVIMAELLADPGFDLIYPNTGSAFIPRDNGPEAIAAISAFTAGMDDRSAAIIYPEGRLFRPDRLQRSMQRLAAQQPDRAARLASLQHVLPPRPGGVLSLLATTEADVVVVAHAGLDRYPSFADLAREVPLRDPITVVAWRIPRIAIPTAIDEQIAWLDRQWIAVDTWVSDRH